MKITFVSDTYTPQPNGVATTLHHLVRGLRKLGHEVNVIRPAIIESDEQGMRVPSVALPGYSEIRVGLPIKSKLVSLWEKEQPDIIYVATEFPLGTSAIAAARSLDIPVASGFHTNFQQYVAHYNLPLLENMATSYLRHVHNRSSATFVPSRDVIGQLHADGFKNLKLLPKGVDTKLFSPKRRRILLRSSWGASNSSLVGLYVGRIAPEKNLPLVVRTFEEIQKRIPDFKGVIVGDGPKLEQLKEDHPEFIYEGVRKGKDLAEHYASADLFIFPSLTETFGNVTLEAMASGLAVLAFDYAAARQYIRHQENGYTVPFGDEEAFINTALEVAGLPHREFVREEARRSARKVRWKKVAKQFQDNLKELIHEKRNAVLP